MPTAADLIRRPPFGPMGTRKLQKLDVRQLHPSIHIAHRRVGNLQIRERIILDHELVLILKGRGRFVVAGKSYPFSSHTLFFVPPFVAHSIEGESASIEHVAIHFDFDADSLGKPSRRRPYRIELSHGLSIPLRMDLQPSDGVECACLNVVRSFAAIDPLAEAEASAQLAQLLVQLMRLRPTPASGDGTGRTRALVEQAIKTIESKVTEKLTAEEVATSVGLSESHLNRIFRQQTGYAPMDYARRYRVQKAKELLGDLSLSVKEIARRTGFDDAYHFSRVFRQIAGVPPTGYRDALLSRQTQ
jgi:AraC-like DNA-binding protein